MIDTPLSPETTPVAFDLLSTSASVSSRPCIPAQALKPEPAVSSSAGPQNQELNDTKKPEKIERERGRGSCGNCAGLELVLCVYLQRGSSGGLSYTKQSEETEEKETVAVFAILSAFSPVFFKLAVPHQRANEPRWFSSCLGAGLGFGCNAVRSHSALCSSLTPP